MAGPTPETAVPVEKIVDFKLEQMALSRANATPMPGELVHALGKTSIHICNVEVRAVVMKDFTMFQLLESPILQLVLEMQKPIEAQDEIKSTDEQEWELIWQFTHPAREVWELMQDREAFRKRAADEIGFNPEWDSKRVQGVIAAILQQLVRHGKACAEHEAQAEGNGEVTFFRDTKASPVTG